VNNKNKKGFSSRQKVVEYSEDTMSSGKLLLTFGTATGNAMLPTVCNLTDGTGRQSVPSEHA